MGPFFFGSAPTLTKPPRVSPAFFRCHNKVILLQFNVIDYMNTAR